MLDIVFLAIPYAHIGIPPLGISVLNGVVKAHGFTAKSINLAMELSKYCKSQGHDFESTQIKLRFPDSVVVSHTLEQFFDLWVDRVLAMQPRYIGISVFSYYMHFTTWYLCGKIRARDPNMKIVLGGAGVRTPIHREVNHVIPHTAGQRLIPFGKFMTQQGLADHAIEGDGEQAIVDLLSKDSVCDQFHLADYKQGLPFSNFDDFDFADYTGQLGKGFPQIPMFTSKGCVRDCDFCDVNSIQQRFRFRQGENVVKEMIYLADRYNIRDFNFADSLVNGSLKTMVEWVTKLAEYNRANPDRRITWSGSWICRLPGQTKPEVYRLMAESGCETLSVGAESGSNHVLDAMDKKTTVEALLHEAKLFNQYGIKFITMIIVGHWSERWQDFVATLDMMYQLRDYVKTGNYVAAGVGTTMSMIAGTPMRSKNIEYSRSEIWWTELNPELTAKERYYRLLIMERFCKLYNIPIMERILPWVSHFFGLHTKEVNDFYVTRLADRPPMAQLAQYNYEHFDEFIASIESRFLNTGLTISLTVESFSVNGDPDLTVNYNGQPLLSQTVSEGVHTWQFDKLSTQQYNTLTMGFSGKQPNDTQVDTHGAIVKDKCVLIKSLKINNFDITDDIEFFQTKVDYQEHGASTMPKFGFWINDSAWSMSWHKDFDTWYHKHSKKNNQFAGDIITTITMRSQQEDDELREQIVGYLKQLEY